MAKSKKEEALAVNPKGAGALVASEDQPAFLARKAGQQARGFEAVEQSDLKLPRLGLAQSQSPQLKKVNPKYIRGLQEGQFFNSLTGEVYGEEVLFVPLFLYKSRIKFNPFEDGGGIDCQSFNGKTGGRHAKACEECAFSKFGEEKGTAPECDLIYNFPAFLGKKRELIVVSFKSTGITAAKDLLSLAKIRNRDMFAGVYKLSNRDEHKKGNDYKVPVVGNAGWVDAETFDLAEQAEAGLRGKKIEVDQEGEGRGGRGESEQATQF